ncbi:T9SS type A sorting domain-containing protein [Flavivirga abyssicola]|uniref:T9SS type A sorting domain-containing protein n=1 Tax=Flavivirga abyssicola TaxID=3063533 RepID=UPI0026DF14A7|nr:T9SS type A sorting domain-containing protein [Flavivirga sp. MEBiC07777]WVK12740.1 T9SS type A sorting domain-containing protein [Flavivirga sp. MEBiC07777]
MKKITLVLFLMSSSLALAQITFDWEANNTSDVNGNITHANGDFNVTASKNLTNDFIVQFGGNTGGTSGNVLFSNDGIDVATFTFNDALNVDTFRVVNVSGSSSNFELTFSPSDGAGNMDVVITYAQNESKVVNLNWSRVTSFTVTAVEVGGGSSRPVLLFDDLNVTLPPTTTTFDWEENAGYPSGDIYSIEHSKNGITVTAKNIGDANFVVVEDFSSFNVGLTGNVFYTTDGVSLQGCTFTFSQPVNIVSMLTRNAIIAPIGTFRLTYSTTDGVGNNDVTLNYPENTTQPVNFNWTGVTSFLVTFVNVNAPNQRPKIAFDDLIVTTGTLSTEKNTLTDTKLYPNPVNDILNISSVTTIDHVSVYNMLGKEVVRTKYSSVDVSGLSSGVYIVKINSDNKVLTKRIIKQ